MRIVVRAAFLMCLAVPAAVLAQAPSQDNPISAYQKGMYGYVKGILLSSAEKMPEEHYPFKPTEAVRSYGQIVGHVADAQYLFLLDRARGEEPGVGHREDQDDQG